MTLPTPTVRARSVVPALVALLLVALNLRLAITSASVLLKALSAAGELTPLAVVLIPAIPTAVFAVAGFGAARAARLVGTENAVLIGMITLTVGLVIRGVPHPVVIVVGTVLATGGLAIVNVLLPAIVRAHFGGSIRPVTTAYSTTMSLGAATAAAVAVPIATGIGTPSIGLAFWAIPALIATLVWLFVMPRRARHLALVEPGSVDSALNEAEALDADEGSVRTKLPRGTKRLATYFALQSLAAYVVMGLLPTIATDAGISPERSGALLGIVMLVGVPATVVFVSLARSANLVRVGFSSVAVANIFGILGLLLAPAAAPELWAVLLGLGMSAFPMLLALIAGFGRDAGESARVSAVAQSVGYSLATVGPLAAGAVHQLTGSWTLVLGGLLVLTLAQALVGFALSRATHARDSR